MGKIVRITALAGMIAETATTTAAERVASFPFYAVENAAKQYSLNPTLRAEIMDMLGINLAEETVASVSEFGKNVELYVYLGDKVLKNEFVDGMWQPLDVPRTIESIIHVDTNEQLLISKVTDLQAICDYNELGDLHLEQLTKGVEKNAKRNSVRDTLKAQAEVAKQAAIAARKALRNAAPAVATAPKVEEEPVVAGS